MWLIFITYSISVTFSLKMDFLKWLHIYFVIIPSVENMKSKFLVIVLVISVICVHYSLYLSFFLSFSLLDWIIIRIKVLLMRILKHRKSSILLYCPCCKEIYTPIKEDVAGNRIEFLSCCSNWWMCLWTQFSNGIFHSFSSFPSMWFITNIWTKIVWNGNQWRKPCLSRRSLYKKSF